MKTIRLVDTDGVATCEECLYWDDLGGRRGLEREGWCRRQAPTREGWPHTIAADWCGEWVAEDTSPEPPAGLERDQAMLRDWAAVGTGVPSTTSITPPAGVKVALMSSYAGVGTAGPVDQTLKQAVAILLRFVPIADRPEVITQLAALGIDVVQDTGPTHGVEYVP